MNVHAVASEVVPGDKGQHPERPISSIQVGDRRREDLGDIQGLADSIQRYGLLHPIVIDDAGNLVAGGRRLRACQQLGWDSVPVRQLGTLTETELREIELEENLRRKDLTDHERMKNMLALAEVAAQALREEARFLPKLSENPKGGRPDKPDSEAKVAERIGISQQSLNRLKQQDAAIKAHPQLAEQPQTVTIEYARAVKEFPELSPERSPGLPPEKVVSMAATLRRIPEGPERDSARRGAATWHKSYGQPSVQERVANAPSILAHQAIDHLQLARKIIERAGGPEAIASDLEGDPTAQMAIAVFLDEIAVSVTMLTEWQQALGRIGKLRRIK